jgi:hypothetical protein
MKTPFPFRRKCIYYKSKKRSSGFILEEYEEKGGPEDGQEYILIEDEKSKNILHVKKEDVIEIIN